MWAGIPIVPPGTNNTRTFRITNIRANAAGVPASTSLVPTQIFAFISISASQSLALNNPQQAVAFVLPGLQFDVRSCTGGVACSELRRSASSRRIGICSTTRATSRTVRTLNSECDSVKASRRHSRRAWIRSQVTSVPGVVYNTESGFVRTDMNGPAPVLESLMPRLALLRASRTFRLGPDVRQHQQRSVCRPKATSVHRPLRPFSSPRMRMARVAAWQSAGSIVPVGVAVHTTLHLPGLDQPERSGC